MAMDPTGGTRGIFRGLDIAASGLSAQRLRIETIAQNIAGAEAWQADGTPYQRKVVRLQEVRSEPLFQPLLETRLRGTAGAGGDPGAAGAFRPVDAEFVYDPSAGLGGVRVAGVETDA
ncbi:MAG: hypothetical protein D6701_06675, partial [Gemmatimonadetes bacterium]